MSVLLATFASVETRESTSQTAANAGGAQAGLTGRRCAIAGRAQVASEGTVEAAIASALAKSGAARTDYMHIDEAADADRLTDVDTLVLCAQALSINRSDARETWRMNVSAIRSACQAAEEAGVRRIVMLGSILSLGHSPDGSAIDAATPYLTDDRRGVVERSLFRGEMEAWQMASRGVGVTVVCGGIVRTAADRWTRQIDPGRHARLLSTPAAVAKAMALAATDGMEGRRLICTGLGESAAAAYSLDWRRPSLVSRFFGEVAMAERMLKRLGAYASDFPPAEL